MDIGLDSPTVLTIDDEQSIRDSIRNYLEDYDFKVLEAENGEQGLLALEANQPDIVLVDLRMPEVDGLDVLAWMKIHFPQVPVIVVSGTGVVSDVIEALKLGAWDYLLKPIEDLEILRLSILRALEKAHLQEQTRIHKQQLQQQIQERTRQLEEANQQLRLAASAFNTHDAIVITDETGCIERVNQALVEKSGFSEQELIGQTPKIWRSNRQDRAFYRKMWKQLLEVGHWQGELWNLTKNRDEYPVWQSITAVHDEQQRVRHYVGIATDVSTIKDQQATLERQAIEEQVLAAIAALSMEKLDIDSFLEEVVMLLVAKITWLPLLHHAVLWLTAREEPCDRLNLTAVYGFSEDRYSEHPDIPFGQDNEGLVARSRQIAIVKPDEATHFQFDDSLQLMLPISRSDQLIGILTLYFQQQEFAEHSLEFLSRISDVVGLGVLHRYAEEEIEHQAYHDSLTGLPNRQLLIDRMEHELALAKRHSWRGVLFFLDLDHFKTLNDALGHGIGDRLLQDLAMRLKSALREGDTVARLGGDEFVVLLPCSDRTIEASLRQACVVTEKLQALVQEVFVLEGHEYLINASIGVAVYPDSGETPDDLLKRTDAAMYKAKADGRNLARFYSPSMQQQADQRLYLERELRKAIESELLVPHYQPQLDKDLNIVGAEVLLRWQHPEKGWISPAEFIPIAEETGFIVPLGEWLIEHVSERFQYWITHGLEGPLQYLSINISPKHFYQREFADNTMFLIGDQGLKPERIVLEITEGTLLKDIDNAISKMSKLKQQGIRMSLDDFGTGYSSLSYLKQLPLSELKIDRSFINGVETDDDNAMIVDTILSMAGHFGLCVVAEGVETEASFSVLNDKGCDLYQGFLFSKAVPETELLTLLKQGQLAAQKAS